MTTPDLHQLDLNLLRSLGDLLETAHVTRAAERAGVAQPVMSRSLAKLRTLFRDPLLVPVGRRLELSPRARALRPRVQDMLLAMRVVLEEPEAFAPSAATGIVRAAVTEYSAGPIARRWALALRANAADVSVHMTSASMESLSALAEGELDLVIGPAAPGARRAGIERFVVRPLTRAAPVCVLGRSHGGAKKRWDLEAFCRAEHVLVSTDRPGPSTVDQALRKIGRERRVALSVPSIGAALSAVAESKMVAVVPPDHLDDVGLPLITRPVPFPLAAMETYVLWSPRMTHVARHQWLRSELFAVARSRLR